jgi:tripartite motif-containing protein 71
LEEGGYYIGGISTDAEANVYVFDSLNNRIQKFDKDGRFILEWGSNGTGNGQFSLPLGTVDASNGLVYVADYGNHRIQVFDLEGKFLDKWGNEGRRDGQFNHPSAIAVARDGSIYVAEDSGGRIQHFDRSGRFLDKIGEPGIGNLLGIAINSEGKLLVTAGPQGTIFVFDTSGEEVMRITEISGLDSLGFPSGISVAGDGSVYVTILPPDAESVGTISGELINVQIPAGPD